MAGASPQKSKIDYLELRAVRTTGGGLGRRDGILGWLADGSIWEVVWADQLPGRNLARENAGGHQTGKALGPL
jgi:hypothetical protein